MKKRKLSFDLKATPSTISRKVQKTVMHQPKADFWSVMPEIPSGFSEDVFEEHITALQKESGLTRPNQAKISELMKSTFEVRRRDIMSKIRPIREIVSKYPPLVTCAGVSTMIEFCPNL